MVFRIVSAAGSWPLGGLRVTNRSLSAGRKGWSLFIQ